MRIRNFIIMAILGLSCTMTPRFKVEDSVENFSAFTRTVIPLQFDSDSYPYANVTIQGKIIPLHIDTGATSTTFSIPAEQLSSIKVTATRKNVIWTNAHNTSFKSRHIIVHDIHLGDLTMKSMTCLLENYHMPPPFMNIGIIGWRFLQHFNVLIDYQAARMILYKNGIMPENFNAEQWTAIPLDEDFCFHATLNDSRKKLRFGLDTGAILSDHIRRASLFRGEFPFPVEQQFVDGVPQRLCVENQILTVGTQQIGNLNFLIEPLPQPDYVDGLLGCDFFFKYRVFFDNQNRIMYVQAFEPQETL